MPRKKRLPKIIHYVQIRTYQQSTYLSYLDGFHSKIKPISYNIDRILNNKWIEIQRPKLIEQFNENYQQEIKKDFLHKINLFDYKYSCLNNQFDENNQFIRECFSRSFEIIDDLFVLFQQIENGEKYMYEYRLNLLKYEFEQEREALKHLFIDQEFKELDNQINVLNAIEQDDILQQSIQFKLNKRQLEELFFKDINILHGHFNTQINSLRSTINEIIHSNAQRTNLTSKHCHHLSEKTRQGKERIDQEQISISILKRKIKETKTLLNDIDTNSDHLYDKLNQLKQCSNDHQNKDKKRNVYLSYSNELIFRRLSVRIHNVQKDCQKKLSKAERLLLLINQCERLEFEDEKLLLTATTKMDFNQMRNKIISQVHNCRLEYDSFFDELSQFWKRFAHVQMDIFIRIEEKNSQKKLQNFLKKKLKILF